MSNAQFCPVGRLDKVLIATDGSQYSEGAIREAISFASKCSSRLYVCMTIETNPEYETTNTSVLEKEESEASAHLEAIRSRAQKEGVSCETTLHEGIDAAQAIIDDAAEKKADVIFIGRRGRKGLMKALMGELAAKVVIDSPCKVLVVPRAAKIEYRNILVATDGSGHSIAAVKEAINIAKRCGSRIIALSSIRSNEELEKARANVKQVLDMAAGEGIEAEALTPEGRSYNLIVETAGGRGVDLIVMGIPVKSAIEKFFTGSATEKVIGAAGCAVLIVKGEASVPATV
ncbi:MAG: universal stress protein [Nitrospirae bacterium]|nr:universal stress protein [Nitrospirota bacterium]